MPFHLLDFFGLEHHHHDQYFHDDASLTHHASDVHSAHQHDAASFLASPSRIATPHHHHSEESSAADWLASSAGAAKLTAWEAASFLDSGLPRNHASASSFFSIQKSLTDIVQATPPAALVPLHALSIVGAVPGHVAFELGEGFLFGFQKGFVLALAGKTLGSAVAFGIGRNCGCLKDRLTEQMDRWPLAKKVAKGVEKGGGLSVFIIRMAPVPCVIKNYSMALATDIPFSTYLIASFAGLVPTTAAHVYAGTLAPSAVALYSGGIRHISAVQAATLASPVVAGVMLSVVAGYFLHQHVLVDSEEKEGED